MSTETLILAFIAVGVPAFSGLILGILTYRSAARKDMITLLQTDNETLRRDNREAKTQYDREIRELQIEIDQLRALIAGLQRQIVDMGGVPIRVVKP